MRRNIVVVRTTVKLAAAVVAAGLAVSACSTVQMGAAAITANSRISSSTLTADVANLNAAYVANARKHLPPQKPRSQEAQQVLTWLILFQVYDQMATQHGIKVTAADAEQAFRQYDAVARQYGLTREEYWSAGGALPPDLLPELGTVLAIQKGLEQQITGGVAPTTAAGQAAANSQFAQYQCVAAKSLAINVNPQYGRYNYANLTVVLAPPTLAADPVPSPAPSAQLTPHC